MDAVVTHFLATPRILNCFGWYVLGEFDCEMTPPVESESVRQCHLMYFTSSLHYRSCRVTFAHYRCRCGGSCARYGPHFLVFNERLLSVMSTLSCLHVDARSRNIFHARFSVANKFWPDSRKHSALHPRLLWNESQPRARTLSRLCRRKQWRRWNDRWLWVASLSGSTSVMMLCSSALETSEVVCIRWGWQGSLRTSLV